MKEDGLGRLFVRHLVMAVPWGIMLLVVFFIAEIGIKQQVKEGIEFAGTTARQEIRSILNDPQVKQDLKEALEYAGQKLNQ